MMHDEESKCNDTRFDYSKKQLIIRFSSSYPQGSIYIHDESKRSCTDHIFNYVYGHLSLKIAFRVAQCKC